MTRALLGLVLAMLAVYGLIELRPLVVGPSLTLAEPTNNASYPDGLVTVTGRALRADSLTLDGAPLLPDQQGRFETELAMASGTSILTLVATDRFGRRVATMRTIYVP